MTKEETKTTGKKQRTYTFNQIKAMARDRSYINVVGKVIDNNIASYINNSGHHTIISVDISQNPQVSRIIHMRFSNYGVKDENQDVIKLRKNSVYYFGCSVSSKHREMCGEKDYVSTHDTRSPSTIQIVTFNVLDELYPDTSNNLRSSNVNMNCVVLCEIDSDDPSENRYICSTKTVQYRLKDRQTNPMFIEAVGTMEEAKIIVHVKRNNDRNKLFETGDIISINEGVFLATDQPKRSFVRISANNDRVFVIRKGKKA